MQDLLTSDLRYSSSQFKEMGIKEKITELLISTGRENIGSGGKPCELRIDFL